ncbi:MAG: GNAT family N-acetyltransferase [Gemmatimonadaceae bacterium]
MTPELFERTRGEYIISTDASRLDIDSVHRTLAEQYWSEGIPRETVIAAIEGSLPFGVFHNERQVGFARVITVHATFAYLADVYIADDERGNGLGKWLIECIRSYPTLTKLRRFILTTRDASGLYAQFRFTPLSAPARWMEIARSATELYGEQRTNAVFPPPRLELAA